MLEQGLNKKDLAFTGVYRGVVVENVDPLGNGRCKIRIYPMFADVEAALLPWAIYAGDMGGGMDQVGKIEVPQIGAHMWCFFENSDWMQPVFFASAPHMIAPDPEYYTQDELQPQLPLLAVQDDGIHEAINQAAKKGVEDADGGTWDEPDSAYAAEYPHNKVERTKAGLVIEKDDTGGKSRFHIYHPAGTRIEIDNDGNVTTHNASNSFRVTIGNENVAVDGNCNVTVAGTCNLKAGKVKVNSGDIHLANQGGAKHPAVHGDTLTAYLDSLCAWIDAHTHTSAGLGSPSSPPIQVPAPKEENASHSGTTVID